MAPQDVSQSPWMGAALALIGSAGIAAAWVAASLLTSSQCGWMAVIAALDAAWLLRLGRAPSGWARMALGVAATLLAIALAQWGIVAAHLSGMLGPRARRNDDQARALARVDAHPSRQRAGRLGVDRVRRVRRGDRFALKAHAYARSSTCSNKGIASRICAGDRPQ